MAAIARMVVVARRVRMKVLVRRSMDACAILVLYCERWRLQVSKSLRDRESSRLQTPLRACNHYYKCTQPVAGVREAVNYCEDDD